MNAPRKQAKALVNNLLEASGITDKKEQARLRKKVMANFEPESEGNYGDFYFSLFIGNHLHVNSCWTLLLESYQEQYESLREFVAVEVLWYYQQQSLTWDGLHHLPVYLFSVEVTAHRLRPLSEARYLLMRSSDSRSERQIVGCGCPEPSETLLEAVTRRYCEVQKAPFVRPFCLCSEVCGDQ